MAHTSIWLNTELNLLKVSARVGALINLHLTTPSYSHWCCLSSWGGWTTVTQRWLAFHPISPSGCSWCRILLLGLCFPHRRTTASSHSWRSCTGWKCRSGSASSLSWLFWYTDDYTRQLRRTLLRNSISHLLTRLVGVSALHRHHRSLSHAPVFQTSAMEFFSVDDARL